MHIARTLSLCALTSGALLLGCGDDHAAAPSICDRSRVDEARACAVDAHCPCGTHCELGRCAASCKADTDCGSNDRCDEYGRCRQNNHAALLPAAPAETGGTLRAPARVVFSANGEANVTLQASGLEVPRARIVTRGASEVRCPGATAFTTECMLGPVRPGATVDLTFRATTSTDEPDRAPEFVVFTDSGNATVSAGTPPALAPAPLDGVYKGTGYVTATGTGAPSAPGATPEYRMQIPFEARIEGTESGAVVVIDDPFGALTSAGALTGKLQLGAASDGVYTGALAIPAAPFAAGTLGNGARWELVATVQATVTWRPEAHALGIELTEVLSGLGVSAKPVVAWQISLARAGDRASALAAPRPPATLSYDEDTEATKPLAWEAEAAKAAMSYAALTDRERRERQAFFPGESTRLDACLTPLPVAGQDEIGRFPIGMYVGSGSVTTTPAGPDAWQRRWDLFHHSGTTDELLGFEIQSVSGTANADLIENKIPCRTANGATTIRPPALGGGEFRNSGTTPSPFAPAFNICEEVAAATGCTVELVSTRPISFQGTGRVRYRVGATGAVVEASDVPFDFYMSVRAVCHLPQRAFECGPLVSCATPDTSGTTAASLLSSTFGTSLGAVSQELECASGGRSAAIDLDLANDTGSGVSSEVALASCTADLARLREAPPQVGSKTGGEALAAVFGAGSGCLSPGRFLTAVSQSLPSGPVDAGVTPERLRDAALGQRLLGRWLDLHAFLATELVERDKIAEVLRREGAGAPMSATSGLEASLGAWDLLFLPRVARALDRLAPEVLAAPDYRERAGVASRAQDDQRMGLPAKMFSTLASQGQLLDVVLERAAFAYDPEALGEVRAFLPRFLAAGAIAHGLERRAAAHDAQFGWQERFLRSEQRAAPAVSRVIARADGLRKGHNPLGIEDVDLPLYFLADESAGPGGRFAAVSDFLLGTGPDSTAWAPSLVKLASTSLGDARKAYTHEADRQFKAAFDLQQYQLFVDDAAYDYDVALRGYCGPTSASLVSDPGFQAAKCFYSAAAGCSTSVADYAAGWKSADVMANLCVAAATSSSAAAAKQFSDPSTKAFTAACYDAPRAAKREPVIQVVPCGDGTCASCTEAGTTTTLPLRLGTFMRLDGGGVEAGTVLATIDDCERKTRGRVHVPVPPPGKPLAECVNGSLGEAALATHTAAREVEIARQEVADLNERYAIAVRSCQLLDDKNQKLKDSRAAFDKEMSGLITARTVADSAATVASAVSNCFSTLAGASGDTPWGAVKGAVATGVSCAADGVAAAAQVVSHGLSAAIENAQRRHDDIVADIEGKAEVQICFNDARQELVGMRGAALRVEQAVQDLQVAHAFFASEMLAAQILHDEGIAYVKDLEDGRLSAPAGQPWLNEPVKQYEQYMRLARRATYLAVRAVEYEFQASLPDRAAVLSAQTPDALSAVLSNLWATAGTRTVGGNRPSDLHVVVSLRDDVLRLGDASSVPATERSQTPAARFRELLQEHRYAEYDASGKYLGQRIPFTLAPLGALGLPADGIPIYATTDCAERLWSVNASVVGADVQSGSETTFTRVDLLKQNTFFSQWCGQAPPEEPFQVASVRPARNLFREPDLAPTLATSQGVEQGDRLYSRARIQAFFNVDRAKLEDPTYMNGETSELAGRGLYGEYALFVPAALIAEEAGGGAFTPGVVLDRVEDILLRFDYVSVAR